MKHAPLFILALSLSLSLSLSAQTPISKAEMYEDFDQFVEIIKTYNAQIEARKLLTGYDMIAEIQKEREKIESLNYLGEFYYLMKRCLYKTLDVHAQLCTEYYQVPKPYYAPGQSLYSSESVDYFKNELKKYRPFEELRLDSTIYHRSFLLTMNFYLNGKYYEYGTYNFINRNTGDTFKFVNFEILECDDVQVDKWFAELMSGSYEGSVVSWDFQNGKYRGKWISLPRVIKIKDVRTNNEYVIDRDSFNLEMNGRSYVNMPSKIKNRREKTNDRVARYFKKGHVLYIYTKYMLDPQDNFGDSIKFVGKGKRIDKVIIDVRGNRGGGDQMWRKMLSAIIRDTLIWDYRLSLNDNDQVKSFLKKEYPRISLDSEYRSVVYPLLGGKRVLMPVDTEYMLVPDSNSLAYTGKIYLLQDEETYSSGHSLTSIARMIPQLVSVGMPTGNLAGLGFNPWLFQLKNSKFTFSMETGIDLSGVETLEDVFQDRPEIEVYPTFDEYIKYYRSYGFYLDMHDKEFLYNYDYLFKYIMNLKD